MAPVPAFAEWLECRPAIKVSCEASGCTRETEGFQHAEHFTVDTASARIEACLWTMCYGGAGVAFQSADGLETTVVARLEAEGDRAAYASRVVSITVNGAGDFVVIWDHGARGLVFDQGTCRQAGAPRR